MLAQPPDLPPPTDASVVFVAFALVSCIWYFAWGKKNFKGPPMAAAVAEMNHT